jgi:PKD repeat protein
MKKTILLFCLLTFGRFMTSAQENRIPGMALVMLNPKESVHKLVESLNQNHPGAQFSVQKEVTSEWNIWVIGYDTHFISDESALISLRQNSSVTLAQHEYEVYSRATAPNDATYNQQWALKNTGQSGGTSGADIDAELAWDITTGGTTAQGDVIVVAVIDGGFQGTHPDLQPNYWVNTAEVAGNGIDDDGNGYVDDVNGWNAFNNNGTISSDQHGTHVAGIIGAKGNNSTGVSGVNWDVKVMRIRGSSGTTSVVVAAYAYAAKQRKIYNQTNGAQGAFVVATNSSFGVDGANAANYPVWCAFYDTLGVQGILSAGAGPNNNTNIDVAGDMPTTCPSKFMVAVTNTTRTDVRNSSSGYGVINMDLGAPGTDIRSTVPNNTYSSLTGTSMATPYVAGAIGLYYAAACTEFITAYKTYPDSMARVMRTFLLTGVDSIPSMANTTASKGRLNVYKGIQRVLSWCVNGPPPPPEPPVAAFISDKQSVCIGSQISFTDQSVNNPTSWQWTFAGGSPATSNQQNPNVVYNQPGTYAVTLTVTNAGGNNSLTQNGLITVYANPTPPTVTLNGGVLESSYATGNQWYDFNGMINGANGQQFTPSQNGVYYTIHTDANGCVSVASNTVLLNASSEEWLFESFNLYPNPIRDFFTVNWSGETSMLGYRIFDINGRLMLQGNVTETGNLTVNVSSLASGSYILELTTDKGTVNKPLVK